MWFIFALLTTLFWGTADLFYKKGAEEADRYSHLKTAMTVGFVMGGHAIATLIITGVDFDWINIIKYLPVSLMYILSMTVGYFGLRYLELSISSPIQNASGAVTCLLCLVLLNQSMDILSGVAVIAICVGVFLLGLFERISLKKTAAGDEKRYKIGLVAFMMPILYCIIDALGTFFDAYYLDDFEATPLVGVTEDTLETVANVSYELTFLLCAVIILIVFVPIKKQRLGFSGQKSRCAAAFFETAGQAVYVYAMSGNGVVAAPMIASYSIVSLILSRIFLKEKLTKAQYAAVVLVMAGIAMLGIVEGLEA